MIDFGSSFMMVDKNNSRGEILSKQQRAFIKDNIEYLNRGWTMDQFYTNVANLGTSSISPLFKTLVNTEICKYINC